MSRSKRRTPIFGMTTAESDKQFKSTEHRRERRIVQAALKAGFDTPLPKEFGNPCKSEKDGKQWFEGDEKLMRK